MDLGRSRGYHHLGNPSLFDSVDDSLGMDGSVCGLASVHPFLVSQICFHEPSALTQLLSIEFPNCSNLVSFTANNTFTLRFALRGGLLLSVRMSRQCEGTNCGSPDTFQHVSSVGIIFLAPAQHNNAEYLWIYDGFDYTIITYIFYNIWGSGIVHVVFKRVFRIFEG